MTFESKKYTSKLTNTLPETNIFTPENGWLEYDPFLLGFGLFSGASCYVSFREGFLWQKNRSNRTHRTHGTHGPGGQKPEYQKSRVRMIATERGPLGFGPIQLPCDIGGARRVAKDDVFSY